MITLSEAQMPNHDHTAYGTGNSANQRDPSNHMPATGGGRGTNLYQASSSTGNFNALQNTGGSQAHNNLQPFIAMNFIIAMVGLYPSRG